MRRTTVELLLAEGDWTRALAEADLHRERLGDVENVAWAPWRSLTARALDGSRRDGHGRCSRRSWSRRGAGAPRDRSRARCGCWARSATRTGSTFCTRRSRPPTSPARLEHAKALTALGSALRLARKPSDARAPLRDAFEIASHCGAQPLAEHARNELYAAGRPRRQALSGPESLTPSERRVAEMAAAGQSNRDIAQSST